MRFYLKLLLMLGVFAAMQASIRGYHEPLNEWIFTIRCAWAMYGGDEQLMETLIVEGQEDICRRFEFAERRLLETDDRRGG